MERVAMQLWLLRPRIWTEAKGYEHGLWSPWYDKTFGLVVRADTEADARRIAAGDDNWERSAWLDTANSTCIELTPEGEAGVVIVDFWRS